ncbi:type II toxin-antitoxin system MqsR family toxin [Pseudomonas sp. M5A4_2d]
MEKYTPHYDLAVIIAQVKRLGDQAFTSAARITGRKLGLETHEMVEVVCHLQTRMLYKSMTTYADPRVWQDVYHISSHGMEIYIKVTYCPGGKPPVISFKERNA